MFYSFLDVANLNSSCQGQPGQAKYPVTITTIKKQDPFASNSKSIIHTFTPSITNTTSANLLNSTTANSNIQPKKSLVYQIIDSLEVRKQKQLITSMINTGPLNPNLNRPNFRLINKSPTLEASCSSSSSGTRNLAIQQSAQQMSMFKFDDACEDLEAESQPDENNNIVATKDTIKTISTIKTILPSPIGGPKYKTFVKIVTPEKNNPESGPKIRISSSYLMPARSCLPVSDHINISAPKIVSMPSAQQQQWQARSDTSPITAITATKKIIIPPNQASKTYLSSFVPIRPKTSDSNASGYLQSVVSSFQAPRKQHVSNANVSSLKATTDSLVVKPKQNAIITLVAPSRRGNGYENIENNKSSDLDCVDSENERDQNNYLEARKRKRKQDLSVLKIKQFEGVSMDEEFNRTSIYNSEMAALRERYNKNNQMDDQTAYFYKPLFERPQLMSALNASNKKPGPSILSKNKRGIYTS